MRIRIPNFRRWHILTLDLTQNDQIAIAQTHGLIDENDYICVVPAGRFTVNKNMKGFLEKQTDDKVLNIEECTDEEFYELIDQLEENGLLLPIDDDCYSETYSDIIVKIAEGIKLMLEKQVDEERLNLFFNGVLIKRRGVWFYGTDPIRP